MNRYYLFLMMLLIATSGYAQTAKSGINNIAPRVTLDVVGNPTLASSLDGIKAPQATEVQLRAKVYTSADNGTIMYVTVGTGIPPAGQTVNVTTSGYYYFDGPTLRWLKFVDVRLNFIPGTLPATGPTFSAAANQNLAISGANIILPPGKWLVGIGTTAAITGTGVINQDAQLWLAASLSDTNGGTTNSADIDISATAGTGRRIVGSLGRGMNKVVIFGYITMNNTSTANKTYYLFASEEFGGPNKPTVDTGGTGHWGDAFANSNWERFFFAVPIQ